MRVVAHTPLILKLMTDNHISQSALLLGKKKMYTINHFLPLDFILGSLINTIM